MGQLILAITAGLLAFFLVFGLGLLFAWPTMVMVNYLFSPVFLTFVFGASKITFWQALVLNVLAGWVFSSRNTSSSK